MLMSFACTSAHTAVQLFFSLCWCRSVVILFFLFFNRKKFKKIEPKKNFSILLFYVIFERFNIVTRMFIKAINDSNAQYCKI